MKQDQFTWNWYHWLLVSHSQWMTLEPLYYSSFFFATLVYGVIGNKFCWSLPQSRSTSWTQISWDTNWAWIRGVPTPQSYPLSLLWPSIPACGWAMSCLLQQLFWVWTAEASWLPMYSNSGILKGSQADMVSLKGAETSNQFGEYP